MEKHAPLIPTNVGIQEQSFRLNRLEAAGRNKANRQPWVPPFVGTSGDGAAA